MAIGDYTHGPSNRGHGKRPRYPRKRGRRREVYPIGKFVVAYLLALTVAFAGKALVLAWQNEPVWFNIIAIHLGAGYALNRFVLKSVVWNPNFTTLAVMAKAKLLALVFWPATYGLLIGQLLIVRYL